MQRIVIDALPNKSTNEYELIFTPTKPIARSLKVSHLTLENVAETVIQKKGLKIASTLLTRRLLQKAIKTILQVKDFVGISAMWTPIIQELLSSGSNLLTLQEHSQTRVRNLAQVAIFYQEQLRKVNCIDRSELFWQATKYCQLKKSCLFYGYFTPNANILAFINALSGHHSLLVIPDGELASFCQNKVAINWLQKQGWTIQKISLPLPSQLNLAQKLQRSYLQQEYYQELNTIVPLNSYADIEAEVRGVLTQVKLLLAEKVKPNDIVLVTKNEQLYGETLLDIAWEYNIPLRAFYDVAFCTTRFGAWLKLLLETIVAVNSSEKLSFLTVTKLLSHPLVKQIESHIWQQVKIAYPQTLDAWQEMGIDLKLLQLPQQLKSDRWIETFQDILAAFNIPKTVKFWAKEILAYYKFQDALKELLLTTKRSFTLEEIIQEIQELLDSLTIPIQPGRGGVELHSPLSLCGSKYQYVFVLGMAENLFPSVINDDLVLGFSDHKKLAQEKVNLNTITTITQKEELAFYFLLQIPLKQISFSYPQIIKQQPSYLSPYLSFLKLQPTQPKNNYLASLEEARRLYLLKDSQQNLVLKQNDTLLSYIYQKWQIEQDRNNKVANEYNGFVEISLDPQKFTFSASQLTQIGQCPFKWFAAKLLKLKETTETKLVLENHLRGSIYHQCLEISLASINTAADLANFNQQQLQQAFQEAEISLNIPDIPSWSRQKQELLTLLSINLNTPEFLTPDSTILEREKEFTTQWHGLTITGTIDRIDLTATGIKIIDYKTSSTPPLGIKDESGQLNLDLQLPLYTEAMAQEYPDQKIDAVYYSLSKRKPLAKSKTKAEDLEKFAQQVKQYLIEGNYPIAPDLQFLACSYCKFDLVCRK